MDNIAQDWQYRKDDQWGSHEFDPDRYPDPKKMLDDVHSMHGRFMISVWPKFYVNTDNYKELKAAGHVYLLAEEDSLKDWLGHVESFYDAYSQGGIHPDRAREARKPPKTPASESYYKKTIEQENISNTGKSQCGFVKDLLYICITIQVREKPLRL